MLVYIVSLIAGALVGYIGSKIFKRSGWGVPENSFVTGLGGIVGNFFLVDFFHSFRNFYVMNSLPAMVGGGIVFLVIMFVVNDRTHD